LVNTDDLLFNLSIVCTWQPACNISSDPGRAAQKSVQGRVNEVAVRTRRRLQKWATGNEAHADEILAAQDSYAYEVRDHQL